MHSFSVPSYWFSFFIKWSSQEKYFMTVTFISIDHPLLAFFWWRPDLLCSPTDEKPSRKVPAPFTPLFQIISELISLILRVVMISCHSHQYFYLGKLSVKSEKLHLPMRHSYSPLDFNPVFTCHGDIIIITITVTFYVLVLLLLVTLAHEYLNKLILIRYFINIKSDCKKILQF